MGTLKLSLNTATLSEHWGRFSERFAALNELLIREVEGCWRDLQSLLEDQVKKLHAMEPSKNGEGGVSRYREIRIEAGRELLREPIGQWERRRPYERALMAIESYDRNLDELVRSLPESIETNGREAVDLWGALVPRGLSRRLARLRRRDFQLPLRALVIDELGSRRLQRARMEGEYLRMLARGIQQLRWNWEIRRESLDIAVLKMPSPRLETEALKREAIRSANIAREAENILSAWRQWPVMAALHLGKRLLKGTVWRRKIRARDPFQSRLTYFTHWNEQLRSLEAEIEFERSLENFEISTLESVTHIQQCLAQERLHLLTELDSFVGWLGKRVKNQGESDYPPPMTEIVPANSRLAEFKLGFNDLLQTLPSPITMRRDFSVLPERRKKTRQLHPRQTAQAAFERNGLDHFTAILKSIEADHQRIIREIEKAREVIAFGLGAGEAEETRDSQIAQEAMQNALLLLEFHRLETTTELKETDSHLARLMALVFIENRLILSRNRLGVMAYISQRGIRQGLRLVSQNSFDGAKRLLLLSFNLLQEFSHRFLVSIGWRPVKVEVGPEIVKRPYLPEEFTVDPITKELPAIYRRLFHFEAVQDPRFLVGRERELRAIVEARTLWENGHPVAVLIIGERGSGKTSLINCAVKRSLEGLPIVRGEFNRRLSTPAHLREFLANLLGLADVARLESELNAQRRVLILEEMERTFLRQIGHYAAVRELQRLIAASCRNTLWIVLTNQIAFRFLDAAISFGQSFSHRLNAAGVSPEVLRDAILLRHNLSGLRLQFSQPPTDRTRAGKIKRLLDDHSDPEKIFFAQMAVESAGIFRSAFEIWLAQIETALGGVIVMKPLTRPDLAPVIEALDLEDLFTLLTILQHGGLTAEEHAIIFQKGPAHSQMQMDELLAREIIEPDPHRIGFRVRPEALRVVKEALYRRNLL